MPGLMKMIPRLCLCRRMMTRVTAMIRGVANRRQCRMNRPPLRAAEPEVPPAQPEPPAQQSGIPPHLADRYAPIIDALETDPSFRQALADAIAARRSSAYVPAAAPQPEQAAKPADEDVEPVCGEDELLEDFERRHGEWERRQQDKRVRAEVEKALSERQEAFQREQFIRRSQNGQQTGAAGYGGSGSGQFHSEESCAGKADAADERRSRCIYVRI